MNNWREGTLVVEEWLLIEYAIGTIPVNPETVVEVVQSDLLRAAPRWRQSSNANAMSHQRVQKNCRSILASFRKPLKGKEIRSWGTRIRT